MLVDHLNLRCSLNDMKSAKTPLVGNKELLEGLDCLRKSLLVFEMEFSGASCAKSLVIRTFSLNESWTC